MLKCFLVELIKCVLHLKGWIRLQWSRVCSDLLVALLNDRSCPACLTLAPMS